MSDKIKPHHLDRKAILYIRESSTYQVSNNLRSCSTPCRNVSSSWAGAKLTSWMTIWAGRCRNGNEGRV